MQPSLQLTNNYLLFMLGRPSKLWIPVALLASGSGPPRRRAEVGSAPSSSSKTTDTTKKSSSFSPSPLRILHHSPCSTSRVSPEPNRRDVGRPVPSAHSHYPRSCDSYSASLYRKSGSTLLPRSSAAGCPVPPTLPLCSLSLELYHPRSSHA